MKSEDISVGKVYLTSKPVDGGFEPVHAKCIKKFSKTSLMQHTEGAHKGKIFTVGDDQVQGLANVEQPQAASAPAVVKESADEIKDNIAHLGETVYVGPGSVDPTVVKENIAHAVKHADEAAEVVVAHELPGGPNPERTGADVVVEVVATEKERELPIEQFVPQAQPTLAEKAAETLNELDAMTVDAAKVLTQQLPPKANLKKQIIDLLKAGHKSPDIAEALGVKVAYVGQIKIDYLGEGPKEGTKKFEVLKLHKEGKPAEEIATALGTSVGFVTQQIRLEKKRLEAQG